MNEGAISELVSRGKKDAFFIQNPQRTWFGTRYERRTPTTPEVLIQLPSAPAAFGGHVDIELPRNADVLKSVEIRINMPTWLPPAVAAINNQEQFRITIEYPHPGVLSGRLDNTTYGWVNGFPNFLIQKWQLMADSMIITEGYGNYSSWEPYMVTDSNRAPILNAIAGQTAETDRDIQNRATPLQLSFRVPLPGCQHDKDVGLPLCALHARQKLYLRLWLNTMENLVESGVITPPDAIPKLFDECPAPWGGKNIYINGSDADGYRTLQEYEVGNPTLQAYCNVLHLDADARAALASVPHAIAYKSQFVDVLTFDKNTWRIGHSIKRILNVRGYFQALFLQFASSLRISENKYRDCNPPRGGTWVTDLSLVVNNYERIFAWDTQQLQSVAQNIRLPRDIPDNLFLLQFGTEIDHEPAGAFFLSQTHKAELLFTIGDATLFPDDIGTFVTLYVYGQGWGILDIKEGIAINRYFG